MIILSRSFCLAGSIKKFREKNERSFSKAFDVNVEEVLRNGKAYAKDNQSTDGFFHEYPPKLNYSVKSLFYQFALSTKLCVKLMHKNI